MSKKNFIPQIWAEDIQRERDDLLIAAKLCNRDYEGEIKEVGDRVKINGISRPTISDYDDENGLNTFERLQDQSTMLEITQAKAFHFYIGDIDKRQSKGDLMDAEKKEAAAALAEAMDTYVYSLYGDAGISQTKTGVTSANVLSLITGVLTKLYENKVPRNETIYLEASPAFIEKLTLAQVLYNTDNTDIITSGLAGKLKMFNVEVYMSTNIKNDNANGDYIFFRTKKAISIADQIKEIRAYEPSNYFGEAVKGLQVYGAKVVRPAELAVVKVKYGAESNI